MSNITVWTKQHENVLKRVGDDRSLHCEAGVYQDGFERTGSGRAGSL